MQTMTIHPACQARQERAGKTATHNKEKARVQKREQSHSPCCGQARPWQENEIFCDGEVFFLDRAFQGLTPIQNYALDFLAAVIF